MQHEELPRTDVGAKDVKSTVSLMGNDELQRVANEFVNEIFRRSFNGHPTNIQMEILQMMIDEAKGRADES